KRGWALAANQPVVEERSATHRGADLRSALHHADLEVRAPREGTMVEDQDSPLVSREQRGQIALLTMSYRPYNLLGPKLMGALAREMKAAHEAGSRAIVLKSGLRHFCGGADVGLFTHPIDSGGQRADSDIKGVDSLRLLELLPVPIVASVHGVCLGGGLELALACDYIIAAASSKLGSVETALGLHPLMGGIQRQVQRIGAL